MNPSFDIIIPVFNEESRLPKTLGLVTRYAAEKGTVGKIIIVDDHSTDSTKVVIADWMSRFPSIVTMESGMKGKGGAVKTGMLSSQAPYALFTDADLSTPIECVEGLFKAVETGEYDVAIGSRHLKESVVTGQSGPRKLLSWGVNLLDHIVLGNDVRDSQCGFKLFSQKAREAIFSRQTVAGFGFDMELLTIARIHGFKVAEIPVSWVHNKQSRVRAIVDSLKIFREMLHIRMKIWSKSY